MEHLKLPKDVKQKEVHEKFSLKTYMKKPLTPLCNYNNYYYYYYPDWDLEEQKGGICAGGK